MINVIKKNKKLAPRSFSEVGGFTLVETVIVIFVFTLLALGVSTLFSHLFSSERNNINKIETIDKARLVLNQMIDDIRFAQFGENGENPILEANLNSLTLNKIRYYQENNSLFKTTNEETTEILSGLGPNIQLFQYYNKNYPIDPTPLTSPIKISDIGFIEINLNISDINIKSGAVPRNLIN